MRQPRLFYGWIVVAVAFLTTLVTAGVRSAPTLFVVPFEQEFEWSRAAIAGAISINLLLFGLGAPISGWLIDRFGARAVMAGNLAILAGALALSTGMSALWHLNLLWGVLIGVTAGGGSVLAATVSSNWFVAKRGVVAGFLGTAGSTGQLVFIPLLMFVVVAAGWRGAAIALVAICLVTLIPVILLMRNDPSDVGIRPLGAGDDPPAQRRPDGPAIPLMSALRTREFWLLAGSFFVCGATSNGLVGTHFIPHSIDHGIPEVMAAATYGIMGGMNFIGTIGSGWLTDRHDARRLLAMYYALRGLSLFILPFVTGFPGLLIFGVLFGLDWLATVPPTIALTAQKFGRASMGAIFGWIFFSHQVGAATSASMAGLIRTWLGDYQVAFLMGGVMCMVGAAFALMLRSRREIAAAAAPVPSAA